MLKYITQIIVSFLLFLPIFAMAEPSKVIRVIDGDTIQILYNGKHEKVRLLRVDTPESVHPDKKQNVPLGIVASEYTDSRLTGKYVDLVFEREERDKYGRLLAYVFMDDNNFNLELVRQGLSPYYTKYGKSLKYDVEFKSAEKSARDEKLGIWSSSESTEKYLRLKSKWGQKAKSNQSKSENKE